MEYYAHKEGVSLQTLSEHLKGVAPREGRVS